MEDFSTSFCKLMFGRFFLFRPSRQYTRHANRQRDKWTGKTVMRRIKQAAHDNFAYLWKSLQLAVVPLKFSVARSCYRGVLAFSVLSPYARIACYTSRISELVQSRGG